MLVNLGNFNCRLSKRLNLQRDCHGPTPLKDSFKNNKYHLEYHSYIPENKTEIILPLPCKPQQNGYKIREELEGIEE